MQIRVKNRNAGLIILSFTLLLIANTASAENGSSSQETAPPSGDATNCGTGVQNITGDQVQSPAMKLKWAPNNPPSSLEPGETVEISVEGGLGIYFWSIENNAGYSFAKYIIQSDPKISIGIINNQLTADASAICPAIVQVSDKRDEITGTINISIYNFEWDQENSPIEFPAGETAVQVSVIGGQGPFTWSVNEGFSLSCTENCGTSNTLSTDQTDCIATLTVKDSCKISVEGKVRRPGHWVGCYRYKGTICYSSPCSKTKQIDFGDHWVSFTSCYYGSPTRTGTCSADG